MKRAACSNTFLPDPSTSGVQFTRLLKSSEDSLCDRFEESDWNEVECERHQLHTLANAFPFLIQHLLHLELVYERCGVNCFSRAARRRTCHGR
ncbi:hypothetical protein AVEN_217718-1 [Araneus ventricosus]|uniref:Uncharacterized protein n=1 Tax=Araneus ventricosus TaxID=182803 RepID=A0A4Y2NJW1_ARAVE|nr:hypothetical protein AVEN_217718-1 [Araneus ventricosus]